MFIRSTNDVSNAFVDSSTTPNNATYSFSKPRIEEETAHEIVETSVISSESLRFITTVWQVVRNISLSSEFLEFLSKFHKVPIGRSDVISLALCDIYLRKPTSRGVIPSELVALHLSIIHGVISRQNNLQ